jgi:Leucine-rich repeat (LRR) protein
VKAENSYGANSGADSSISHTGNSLYNTTMRYSDAYHVPHNPTSSITSTLTLLDLRGSSRLTDKGLLQLSHTPLCLLEVVRLDNCHGVTGQGLLAFTRSEKLHTLSLANCRRLTDEASENVSHLGALVALNLGGCRCLTDRSLSNLANLTELRKLDLSQCDLITDGGLAGLDGLGLIEELNVGWCRRISDEGLKILTEQPNRAQTLCTLHLARCSITDAGLDNLEKLESLKDLDLNGCVNISSEKLGHSLEKLVHLTSLDVSYCPGILRSSWQGKINNLKSLELCYSSVRDSQLVHLKNLPMLEELNLDSCLVGDLGVFHLVEVMPNLTSLDLADNDISDASMSMLAELKHIRRLSLFYCNISMRGMYYHSLLYL